MDKQTEAAPFFSVVIPTYNRAHSIAEAIASVRHQTFSNWELIVVDDGSTDNSRQVVEALALADPRIKYIYQQNAERSAARNNGVANSAGQYICFLDSDDVYLPTHLEAIHAQIKELDKPVAMFYTGSCGMENGVVVPYTDYITKTNDPFERVLKDSICPQRVCLHRQIALKHQFDTSLRINEDRELWARIVGEFPLIAVPSKTVVIRDLGDRTINASREKVLLANLDVTKLIIERNRGKIANAYTAFALSAAYHKLAEFYSIQKRTIDFLTAIFRSFLAMPDHFTLDKIHLVVQHFKALFTRS